MSTAVNLDRPPPVPATEELAPEKKGRKPVSHRWWIYVALGVGLVLTMVPFLWMFLGSLKTQRELLQIPPTWLPENPTVDNYTRLFDRLDFPRFFWNSTFIAVMITLSNLLFCSMVGYALAKLRFAGRNVVFALVIATLLVPTTVLMVPQFVLISRMNLVDTPWAVILPTAAAPIGVFLMRQFILPIPDELLEAARVDGASEWRIFFQIVLPLVGPGLATLAIITFLPAWNALMWPLIVLTSEENYTLPVALAIISRGEFQADYGLLMAGAVVFVLPVILLFLFMQRYFTESVAATGLKG
jgi:multiple sugar transport system permease protein